MLSETQPAWYLRRPRITPGSKRPNISRHPSTQRHTPLTETGGWVAGRQPAPTECCSGSNPAALRLVAPACGHHTHPHTGQLTACMQRCSGPTGGLHMILAVTCESTLHGAASHNTQLAECLKQGSILHITLSPSQETHLDLYM